MFTKVNHTSTLHTGTLETDQGGIVYYGFDTSKGLMWLERSPQEKYSKIDPIWDEAESFLVAASRESVSVVSGERPKTVTRSLASAYSMGAAEDYTAYENEVHEGQDALRAYETENDKVFAEVGDDQLMRRANQLLQVGLEEDYGL